MLRILLSSLLLSASVFAEPSAFSAGDLSSDKPYGLTDNEKLILENINNVKHLTRDKNVIHSDMEQFKIDLEGLRSVVESLSRKSQKGKNLLKKILETQDDLEVSSLDYRSKITALDTNMSRLMEELSLFVKTQNNNTKKIQDDFKIFDKTLSEIEKNYVSKKAFDALQAELSELRTLIGSQFKKFSKSKSPAAYFKEGRSLFSKKKYAKAIEAFNICITKNHKPASSHFYIGESYYHMEKYKQAVSFFKESYKRYKKAKFTAQLFLHMGISLDKLGNKEKAKKVFRTIVKKFPKSTQAKMAKKYL